MLRVMSNLIINAIKFSPDKTRILVTMKKNTDHVFIAVEDEGMGIPQEMGKKIFDMYTDTRRKGTAGEETFGMGLAISRQIVESHRGEIWFENKNSGGTIFFVKLPLV